MDLSQLAKIYKALGDEKRLGILEELKGGERCACVLMEARDMAQSALSYHMKILCQAELVTARPQGKWTYYQLGGRGWEEAAKGLGLLEPAGLWKEE
ncbi:MAG: metalloregulator ArsR/SmtB family transcription factor [Tissierellia bacterium]|nr:metalloregulator ArsR/SmtB family transcription factor [Tissierellia bacterium]